MQFTKARRRKRIQHRIRKKIRGAQSRPRLSIYRSNRDIYCQLIDDLRGHTLLSASSREKGFDAKGTKSEQAKAVGKLLAQRAKDAGYESIVFDRSGYLYHGRVKALADGAREGGLKF